VGRGGGGSGGVERKNEPTSTIDVVDVEFKLRSSAQKPCSILTNRAPIRKVKTGLF